MELKLFILLILLKHNHIIDLSLINIACCGPVVQIFMEVENTMNQILEHLQ